MALERKLPVFGRDLLGLGGRRTRIRGRWRSVYSRTYNVCGVAWLSVSYSLGHTYKVCGGARGGGGRIWASGFHARKVA